MLKTYRKRMGAVLLLLTVFPFMGIAQTGSLLWEIKGKDLEQPSYLYGTIHIRDKRVFEFGDSVKAKLARSKALAGEIVLDGQAQAGVMQGMLMEGDTVLNMLLSRSDYNKVKKYAEDNLGIMASMIDRMKPVFTSAIISETTLNKDKPESLDEYFQKEAKSRNMEVLGIETVEEQMDAVDKIPLKEQAQMLLTSITQKDKEDKMMEKLINAYIKEDLNKLNEMINKESGEAFNKSLLIDRNVVMADRISDMIKKQPTFICIGAGHLSGSKGVINLMREKGYTVEPVHSSRKIKEEQLKGQTTTVAAATVGNTYWGPDSLFKVNLPGKYALRFDTVAESGKAITAYYLDSASFQFFMANQMDTPSKYVEKESDKYYDELVNRMTKNKSSKLLYRKEIEKEGVKGMEAKFKTILGQVMRMQSFVIGNKTIQLIVAGSKASVDSEKSENFFRSLTIKRK